MSLRERTRGCVFMSKTTSGQKLAYVYFEDEPGPAIGGQVAHEG